MSSRYQYQMEKVEKALGWHTRIPQLNEINNYFKDKTGFRLKPAEGIVSRRQLLNALAFKIFHSTQFLRHRDFSGHTFEPDIVHELIGHVAMLADPEVAEMTQKIGTLSLGVSDEEISRLFYLFWFTL